MYIFIAADKLKDTIETTTDKSNESSSSFNVSITTAADYQDTLYANRSTRHIWRYPILTNPVPAWLIGETRDQFGSFDKSKIKSHQSYITFTMSEPATVTSSVGINDLYYYHTMKSLICSRTRMYWNRLMAMKAERP